MPSWKIYSTVENMTTDIPLNELMLDGELDIFEPVQSSNFFSFSLQGDRLRLTARGHVGLIPLNSQVALLVEPRVARDNWLQIVGRADRRLRELPYLRSYARSESTSKSIVDFLSRALILQMADIDTLGLYRQYQPTQSLTSFPRGRILFGQSIRDAWSRGRLQSVVVESYNFAKDTSFNRLIRYALDLSTRYLMSVSDIDQQLLARVKELENIFAEVPLDRSLAYLDEVLAALENRAIPDTRAYYTDICKTAVLIVQNSGLVPKLLGQEATLTFVVNMSVVFQEYCYQVLRDHREELGGGYLIRADDGKKPMFDDPSWDPREAEPDIVIESSTGVRVPVEVKYKDNPSRTDINQAIVYALAYRSRNAILLCYSSQAVSQGWEFSGTIGGRVDVWTYRLDLENSNLDVVEHRFVQDMRTLLDGDVTPLQ